MQSASGSVEPSVAELIVPELVERGSRPRIWTAILIPVVAVVSATVVSGGLAFFGAVASNAGAIEGLKRGRPPEDFPELFNEFLNTPIGMTVMLLPQAFLLSAAILAAWCSPIPMFKRLALGRPRLGAGAVLVCALATPALGELGSMLIEAWGGPSEQLVQIDQMFRSLSGSAFLAMTLGISLLPGVCEELLFRGYMQSRLVQSMPAWRAISISTFVFAFAHVDPMHALAVIPLGAWLGVVAWASGSVWPSVVCHMFNNLCSALMSRTMDLNDSSWSVSRLALALVSGAAWIVAAWLIVSVRRR